MPSQYSPRYAIGTSVIALYSQLRGTYSLSNSSAEATLPMDQASVCRGGESCQQPPPPPPPPPATPHVASKYRPSLSAAPSPTTFCSLGDPRASLGDIPFAGRRKIAAHPAKPRTGGVHKLANVLFICLIPSWPAIGRRPPCYSRNPLSLSCPLQRPASSSKAGISLLPSLPLRPSSCKPTLCDLQAASAKPFHLFLLFCLLETSGLTSNLCTS
jgi:hypothetical protein